MAYTFITVSILVIYLSIKGCEFKSLKYENKNITELIPTTTLYPVNITIEDMKMKHKENNKNKERNVGIEKSLKIKQITEESNEVKTITDVSSAKDKSNKNNNDRKIDKSEEDVNRNLEINNTNNDLTTWTINSNYLQTKNEKTNGATSVSSKDLNKEEKNSFKPSQHLGSFFDEEAFSLTTQPTRDSYGSIRKPTPAFVSSPEDYYISNNKKPIDLPYVYNNNFEKPTLWKYHTSLESKPTAPIPVRVPPIEYEYKKPNKFIDEPKEQPHVKYELESSVSNEEPKENSIQKGPNSWQGFLRLATALLPVGLIVSALTPNLITLQTTDNNQYSPTRAIRGVDDIRQLPLISERCKRRLLCEIHAYNLIGHQIPMSGHKQCYKLQCEDHGTMLILFNWLLSQRRLQNGNRHRENEGFLHI